MFLALAEVRRAKLRFALLTGAVGLLAYLILFQLALTNGLVTQFIGAIRNQSGPVIVFGADARANLEASSIRPEQVDAVASIDGVARAQAWGEGTFTVSTEVSRADTNSKGRLIDAAVFGYTLGGLGAPTKLTEGRLPTADFEAVASSINEDEGFAIGQRVRLEPSDREITIVGLADDINYSVAPTLFASYATYEAAVRILNPEAPAVQPSAVLAEPSPGVSTSALASRITRGVDGVEALTRSQAEAKSPGVSQVRSSFNIIIGLLWFVVLLVTALFFLILTVQKIGPLTVMRAMGASGAKLVSALMIQVVIVMIGGAVVATALFLATIGPAGAGLGLRADPALIVRTTVVLLVLALVGTALGATRRIRRIDPASATVPQGGLR
jgi:putative ABC transport system permease protein